jgi:hypothetical protein
MGHLYMIRKTKVKLYDHAFTWEMVYTYFS